jgi:membrane protease YdiL (CAAX protease family)
VDNAEKKLTSRQPARHSHATARPNAGRPRPFPLRLPSYGAALTWAKISPLNITPSPPDGPASPPGLHPVASISINRWRWWIHLFLVSAYILAIGVIGWEHRATHTHMPALSHTPRGLLTVSTIELLIFALVLGLAVLASRASCDDLLLRWRRGFWPVLQGIGYSVALRLAVAAIMIAAGIALIVTHAMTEQSLNKFATANHPDLEAMVDISTMRQNPLYFWLTLTVVSFVVAGLREEIWRSTFLAGLKSLWPQHFGSRTGRIAAVAIAAVVFGLGHFAMGPLAVLIAGLLGLGLGLIMIFHRSIWPAVIAHGMFDATSLAVLPMLAEKLHKIQQTIGH